MKKRALVLINKTSGTGKAGNDTLNIVTRLAENGYEPVVYPIIPGTNLTSEGLIGQYDGKVDLIMCSGGDGTLNHVVNAIMNMKKKPRVAYLPSGSTNDFAKGIGVSSVRSKAIEDAVGGVPFSYDLGKMNGKYFNYVAAFGAFSKVSYATDQDLKNVLGYAAYVISAISELPQNIGYSSHIRINADGVEEEDDYIFGAVCNNASIGGMNLFGNADVRLNDGKMELVLIHTPKNLAEFNAIISALAMKTVDNPYITFKQVHHVEFESEEEIEWTLDGEFGGSASSTTIDIVDQPITIMTKGKL